ncbi:MAG: efflux RND transporter periplasmic adaptor subunit [candidate division KSB1 bacterium]|nr:efflux RND transporter periplasmic adaptor subunit [candidate division KSB1 bacterium]MDZ7300646.1 efflux RND transporter periplasmic adaptor subunit [candidate division KSB1 bacterium]MDZ7309783.1 efflux RND transporter periplasmic adaptor subunit [candidate division KSB1 bacterium]
MISFSLVFLAACGNGASGEEETEAAVTPVVAVKIDSVRSGSIPEIVAVTGMTKVLRQESISSPIDGKVTSLRVLEGDAVRQGQVIAIVATKEALAALTGAELLRSRAQTAEEKKRAEAALVLAQRNNTALEIPAPFDGVIVARALNEGEFVTAGGALATIIDLRSLYFFAKLPARDLSRIKLGQEAAVSFQSWAGKFYQCKVENIQPQIDPFAQMAEVRLRFLTPTAELRSEMFGTAEIVIGKHENALLVPDKAVLRDDETGVYTIVEALGDSLAVIREIEVGIETPTTVAISGEGLRPGMHIIVEGHYGLPDSTRIRIER